MILIDANIFMYAGGAEHANREPSIAFLRGVARGAIDATTNTEVLQEILHRYRSLNRWEAGQRVFDLARRIVPTALPITVEVVDLARALLDVHARLMARDALHAAVVDHYELDSIASFDRVFDEIAGLVRHEP